MAEYIEREALVLRLKHSPLFLGTNMQFKDGVIDLVKRRPAADVVEVVRCKDCIHYDYERGQCYHQKNYIYVQPILQDKNDFCSYGVAKMDGKGEGE